MWLYLPNTSPSAPALECSTSASSWPFPALAASVTWRGKSRRSQSWRSACAKATWLTRLCGAICEPSIAIRGVAEWAASLAASPAKATPSPASDCSKSTNATSGPTFGDWCAEWTPAGFVSRTSLGSLFQQQTRERLPKESFKTLLKRGGLRSGRLCRRRPLALRTGGSDGSLLQLSQVWPTPNASNIEAERDPAKLEKHLAEHGPAGRPLMEYIRVFWPTARAEDSESAGNHPGAMDSLTGATRQWTTPNVPSRGKESKESKERRGAGGVDLQTQAGMWATPDSGNFCGTTNPYGEGPLNVQSSNWPSPHCRDADKWNNREPGHDRQVQLSGVAQQTFYRSSPPAPATSTHGGESSTSTRRLNPRFVEMLMGWPTGWTSLELIDCDSPAMASYHFKLRSLCDYYCGDSVSEITTA